MLECNRAAGNHSGSLQTPLQGGMACSGGRRNLARGRLIVNDVDAALASNGDDAVLVAKVEAPREPHRTCECGTVPSDGPAMQPRRRSSKESIRGTGAVVQALPATGIGVLRRPKAYWPKKTTYALVDTHESKLR